MTLRCFAIQFLFNSIQPADCVINKVLEQAVNFFNSCIDSINFLLVFVHIIKRNTADRNFEQVINIFICNITQKLCTEWFESVFYCFNNGFFCLHLLNLFIDALFYKDAFQSAQVEFFHQLGFFKFKFFFENANQLFAVIFNNLCTGHLNRHVVFNNKKITVNCLFAVCKGVE